jgi:hypothetical protein
LFGIFITVKRNKGFHIHHKWKFLG